MAYTQNDSGMYSVPLVDFGKRLRDNFGLTIVEHPEFGGVTDVHAPNSYHKYGEAIDIQDWRADVIDGVDWKTRTSNLASMLQGAGPEVLGPGVAGHDSHLHLAATNGVLQLNPTQYNYFFGGDSGGGSATFTGVTGLGGGTPAEPSSNTPNPGESTVLSPAAVNAQYDKMRMAGDALAARNFGMEQHKRLFGKK